MVRGRSVCEAEERKERVAVLNTVDDDLYNRYSM